MIATTRSRSVVPLILILLLAGGSGALAGSTGSGPGAFANTVPTAEQDLGATLGIVPANDEKAFVASDETGAVTLLTLSNGELRSSYSLNDGRTWSPETLVDGASGPVTDFVAYHRGSIYLACLVLGGKGRHEVRFFRSSDMGLSWGKPVIADTELDAARLWAIHTNGAGGVAIAFESPWYGRDTYVVFSRDNGAQWAPPRRVDPGDTGSLYPSTQADVAVAANGRVFAAFVRGAPGDGDAGVYFSTAMNNGEFSTERNFADLLPSGDGDSLPRLAITASGSLILAFADSSFARILYSPDGEGFYLASSIAPGSRITALEVLASPVNPTSLLAVASEGGTMRWVSTHNDGQTWAQHVALSYVTDVAITRTSAGTWLIACEDYDPADLLKKFKDIFVFSLHDDGEDEDWIRYADGGWHTAESRLAGVVPASAGQVFVAYLDSRGDNGRSFDVYCNRGPASPISFPDADGRADVDASAQRAAAESTPVVVSSGARAYVGFLANTVGPWPDVYVAWSSDQGSTWNPVRISSHPSGMIMCSRLRLEAEPGGSAVYAMWSEKNSAGDATVVFARSLDGGLTWGSEQSFLPPAAYGSSLTSNASGVVLLAWTDGSRAYVNRSVDHGATFQLVFDSGTYAHSPKVHLSDALAVLAWSSMTPDMVSARVSFDAGNSWRTRKDWPTVHTAEEISVRSVAGRAVVAWTEWRGWSLPWVSFYASWFQDTWSDTASFVTDGTDGVVYPHLAWVDANTVVAAATLMSTENNGDRIAFYRSTNGGASFNSPEILDEATPRPGAESATSSVAVAGARVAVMWQDHSTGLPQIAIRMSVDGGASFGSVYRLNTETPQNGWSSLLKYDPPALAFCGTKAVGAFTATRRGAYRTTMANAWVGLIDGDGDGRYPPDDCNDGDSGAWAVPVEVDGLTAVRLSGSARLNWNLQSSTAGTGTRYDIAEGLLTEMQIYHAPQPANCVGNDAVPPLDDPALPALMDGFWYLVRAQNSCGASVYSPTGPVVSPCP